MGEGELKIRNPFTLTGWDWPQRRPGYPAGDTRLGSGYSGKKKITGIIYNAAELQSVNISIYMTCYFPGVAYSSALNFYYFLKSKTYHFGDTISVANRLQQMSIDLGPGLFAVFTTPTLMPSTHKHRH